ncbi:hypothetical protein D3C84_693900 [compost metagenome]
MTEGRRRLASLVAEDVTPGGDLHDALVNMHRTARRVRQWLGHADHRQPMLECHFFKQMLEQQCLVGQQQGIAVQQVDLELTDAHLVHERIARQTEGRHALIDFTEKRPQAVIGTDTERRMTVLAPPVQAYRRLERLRRVGVGREDEKLKLGGHHRRQPKGRVTSDNCFELTTSRQRGAFTGQFVRIANGQGTRLFAPGQAVDLRRVGHQRQVAVIAAVKTRWRISAHDALQQHTPRHLQTPPLVKAFGRHDLATGHAVQIRRNTFNLINARQSLRE